MAIFYFQETDTHYQLTDSLGIGVWMQWPKKHYRYKVAQHAADAKVGQYIRKYKPKLIRYMIRVEAKP